MAAIHTAVEEIEFFSFLQTASQRKKRLLIDYVYKTNGVFVSVVWIAKK